MVVIENVGIKFNLGIEKINTFKEFFVKSIKNELPQNEFWALKNVNFKLEKGDVLGIIGVNGAGKSTLLKIVSGVLQPTTGVVSVKGIIAPMLELGAGFDLELTARENIFLNGAILGYKKEFLHNKYQEIVNFSELKDFMEVPIRNFSSGMLARLAFSISTIVEPEILIVDEILSVGDVAFQKKSYDKMKNMISGGTTVLFVSHSVDNILNICNKTIWLEHGQVKMFGDANKVCTSYLNYFNN